MEHLGQASSVASNLDKRVFWRRHISAWRESGLSQAAFCRKYDLKAFQFSYWKKQIANNGEAGDCGVGGAPVTLVQLPLKTQVMEQDEGHVPSKAVPVELRVAGRYPVTIPDGFDPGNLKRLIQLLESL